MNKLLKMIVFPVMLVPAVFLAIIWKRLPTTIAVHFDLHGNPDRYGNKNEMIMMTLILLAMNVFTYFLLTNIYRIDPKKNAVENKERLHKMAFAVAVFLSGITTMILYTSLSGSAKISTGIIFSATGLLFAIIGNYMPNMKPNYFAGFRLPWTLENADNWRKTHALAGKLWFGGGLIIAIICLFLPTIPALVAFFAVTLVIVIIPAVYSYKLYKQIKSRPANTA